MTRRYKPGHEVLPFAFVMHAADFRIRTAAQGVTMNATISENSIAALAPIGIGRMYGPIRPPDESHRQDRGHHGERGENGRIAHLIHRLDRHFERRPAVIRRHAPVPHDVFHHHNRVVHQNADGEDQREQRDPVERVAVEIEHRERQRQRHRNRGEDDQRFAQAQRDRDQHAHRDHRDQHVTQQFVRFFLGRVAVVPRDGHLDVRRNHGAAQRLQAVQHVFGHGHGVGALAFRNRHGHRRIKSLPVREAHILRRLFAAVGHFGDVAHEDRLAVGNTQPPRCEHRRRCAEIARSPEDTPGCRSRIGRKADGDWTCPAPPPPATAKDCTPPAAPGSSVMRISRRCPPISDTAETSGVCLIVSSTCAAMRRSSKSP